MIADRHPLFCTFSGLLAGVGGSILATIYGLIRIEGPWLPLAIILAGAAAGLAFALVYPVPAAAEAID